MRIAQAPGIASRAEVFACLQRAYGQTGPEHRYVDITALPAGAHTCGESGNGEGSVEAGCEIGYRDATFDRVAIRLSCDAHDAGEGLHRQIEAAVRSAWALLPVGRHRAIDEVGEATGAMVVCQANTRHGR